MPVQYIPRVFGGTIVITTPASTTISTGDIYVRVLRAGVQVYSRIYVQLDHIPVAELLYYEGVAPVERFDAYLLGAYAIRQNDVLVDLVNIDPVTSTNYHYRIISIPEAFPDGHMELLVDLLRGGV